MKNQELCVLIKERRFYVSAFKISFLISLRSKIFVCFGGSVFLSKNFVSFLLFFWLLMSFTRNLLHLGLRFSITSKYPSSSSTNISRAFAYLFRLVVLLFFLSASKIIGFLILVTFSTCLIVYINHFFLLAEINTISMFCSLANWKNSFEPRDPLKKIFKKAITSKTKSKIFSKNFLLFSLIPKILAKNLPTTKT